MKRCLLSKKMLRNLPEEEYSHLLIRTQIEQEGIEKGIEKERQRSHQNLLRIAKDFLRLGQSIETVSAITGLSQQELKPLVEEEVS